MLSIVAKAFIGASSGDSPLFDKNLGLQFMNNTVQYLTGGLVGIKWVNVYDVLVFCFAIRLIRVFNLQHLFKEHNIVIRDGTESSIIFPDTN